MQRLIESFQSNLGEFLPNLLGALAILIVGWLVAVVIRAVVRRLLRTVGLNRRIESTTNRSTDYETGVSQVVFVVLMLAVVLAFLNALNLTQISQPIQTLLNKVMEFLPQFLAAVFLIVVAWVVATVVRNLVRKGLGATTLDEKVSQEAGMKPVSESLATVGYWLVFLLFLPAILGALGMQGLLAPVENMTRELLGFLPNLMAGALIGFVGWIIAKLVRDVATNLLSAAGADGFGRRIGLADTMSLSRLVGHVVYILILVPALVSALGAMKIDSIAAPATAMLDSFMAAVPNIVAAALILAISWFVARLVGELLGNLLAGIGFDRIPAAIGLGEGLQTGNSASLFAGKVFVFFAMLFAAMEAAGRLGFSQFADLVQMFLRFGGQVLLGLVIIGVGLWLANLARNAMIRFKGDGGSFLGNVVRFAILGIVVAMGLRAMGLADDIVNLAFGLTLGAMAVAFALSFGLGGRDAAGRLADHWVERIRGRGSDS